MSGWTSTAVAIQSPLINLATLKRHGRISGTEDDDYLQDLLIPAAIGMVQRDTRWTIQPHDYSIDLGVGIGSIRLPAAPYVSATMLRIDPETEETEAEEVQFKHNGALPGILTWRPVSYEDRRQRRLVVRIGEAIPRAELQLLVMCLVAHWYEHREAATADGTFEETPLSYQHLVRALDPMTDAVRVAGGLEIL